jgi:hypothetical protein
MREGHSHPAFADARNQDRHPRRLETRSLTFDAGAKRGKKRLASACAWSGAPGLRLPDTSSIPGKAEWGLFQGASDRHSAKNKGASGITTLAPYVAGQWGRGNNRLPGLRRAPGVVPDGAEFFRTRLSDCRFPNRVVQGALLF